MICYNCNKEYDNNLAVCPHCGAYRSTPAQQAPQQTAYQAPQQGTYQTPQQGTYQAPAGAQFTQPAAPVKKKKNIGKIITIIFFVLVAVGTIANFISENKEATYTFTKEENYDYATSTIKYTVKCKGDTVNEIIVYSESEFRDTEEEYLEEFYDEYIEEQEDLYEDYDFITFTCETDGLTAVEKVVIKDASDHMEELEELDIVDDTGDGDFISYEKTKENLEDDGFELVEE